MVVALELQTKCRKAKSIVGNEWRWRRMCEETYNRRSGGRGTITTNKN
jgi:hypothetical protein